MRRPEAEGHSSRTGRTSSMRGRVACGVMTIAAVALVVAVLLGAPLVSVLLAGLLLLCPLLMWAPIRYQDRSFDSLSSARRGDD